MTVEQFRGLASILRELGIEARTTPRQNIAFRGLSEAQLPTLFARLESMGMAQPGAELASLTGELQDYCRQRLSRHEVPAHFRVVDRLPRNNFGKLVRRELVARWEPDETADRQERE